MIRKLVAFPTIASFIAGLAVSPQGAVISAGVGVATIAAVTSLGGCAKNPGTVDPAAPDIGDLIRRIALAGCQVEPVAGTISQMILALALPAALPIEQQAQLIAEAFCAQIRQIRAAAAQGLRSAPLRAFDANGVPIINYGIVLINGKPVNLIVYAK